MQTLVAVVVHDGNLVIAGPAFVPVVLLSRIVIRVDHPGSNAALALPCSIELAGER
jgi:hypothetical protein